MNTGVPFKNYKIHANRNWNQSKDKTYIFQSNINTNANKMIE